MSDLFFIRVELHGKTADYATLHEIMTDLNWSTTIAANGVNYKLPTAMYTGLSDKEPVDIRDGLLERLNAAGISEKPVWALVIKSTSSAWRTGTV